MYGLKVSSLLALAIAIPQVLATPPACLLACVSQVEQKSSCSSLNDLSCLCSTEYNAVNSCLQSICPNDNASAAQSAFSDSCSGYASSVFSSSTSSSASSSAAPSSSASSVSSSSSAAASSSVASSSVAASSVVSSVASTVSSAPAPTSSSPTTLVTSSSSSFQGPSITESAGANAGKSFGAAAVIGLVGALL